MLVSALEQATEHMARSTSNSPSMQPAHPRQPHEGRCRIGSSYPSMPRIADLALLDKNEDTGDCGAAKSQSPNRLSGKNKARVRSQWTGINRVSNNLSVRSVPMRESQTSAKARRQHPRRTVLQPPKETRFPRQLQLGQTARRATLGGPAGLHRAGRALWPWS